MAVLDVRAFKLVLPVVAEVIVIDNAFFLMGDYNRDGVINEVDLDIMAEHFGAVEGDSLYDPIYDQNSDGVIDILDISTVAIKVGTEAPVYETPFILDVALAQGLCTLIARFEEQEISTELEIPGTRVIFIFPGPLGLVSRAFAR